MASYLSQNFRSYKAMQMLHVKYLCVDRMSAGVFQCLCVYEYVFTTSMLLFSLWVFEMGLFWKITPILIFVTLKLEYIWLCPDFRLQFQQRGFYYYLQSIICLCIKKQKLCSNEHSFSGKSFPVVLTELNRAPRKSIALII